MKINMPVTHNEIIFKDDEFMLTKTDLKGVITYANDCFIKISGFSEAELVGQSHNVVRHPDMPVEAFEDMWTHLKAGKPWSGMVKNRAKNGDFYWVLANAAPIFESGQITGYLSARTKPTRLQVEAADTAYQLFKNGKARGLSIINGKVVKNSGFAGLKNSLKSKLQNISVSMRLVAMIVVAAAVVGTQAAVGLYMLSSSNASILDIYDHRMLPLEDLAKINVLPLEYLHLF